MNDRILRGPSNRSPLLVLWAALVCCVVNASLLPATSPMIVALGRLHIGDRVLHFSVYLALSSLPVIGFRDRRWGIVGAVSVIVLGILMEAGQHFVPGRTAELGDMIANIVGFGCGTLLGLPFRASIASTQPGRVTRFVGNETLSRQIDSEPWDRRVLR